MVIENIFLIVLGLIWIIFAVVEDLKKREIANWINFSLVIFALGFRFFYSLFQEDSFNFFLQGILGFVVFLIIGNLLYYGKVFAGGDAKLMIALGAVIPFSSDLFSNIQLALKFLLFFLIAGGVYGFVYGVFLGVKNRKKFAKEFSREFKQNKKMFYFFFILSILSLILIKIEFIFIYVSILIFISPYIYFFAKTIDQACMIKRVKTKELTEGDWLYTDLKIGKRTIKAKWSGLTKEEILFLTKKKKDVLIRQGIPFSPVFLFAFIFLIIFKESFLG